MFSKFLLIFIFLCSFSIGATSVPDSHIIYTWGYGEMIYNVLEAVRMAIQNTGLLMKAVLLIAFLFIVIKKLLDGRVQPFAEIARLSIVSTILFGLFLYAPNSDKNRYQVFDETTTATYIINEIPIGIGSTFALVSRVEKFFLEIMELAYSTPNSISIRNAGFGFSMESVNTLRNIKPTFLDALWVENMNNFVGVCLHYNAEKDPSLIKKLGVSNDLYNDLLGMKVGFPIGNTISVNMVELDGNSYKESIVPCKELGQYLQQGLENQTDRLKNIHMAQLGIKDMGMYDNKMQGIANLFHTSHTNSRNILQQVMLVHSYRDGIKNMERMYGLGEGTLATTASIAHYSFFNQMLQQSVLAQKFLPLIKAYLTATIIGLSWLIIIFAIITGYTNLRILLTMYLFLLYWTPVLGMINYLNDLFLENKFNTFQKYTDSLFGFNIAFNTEFFIAIQEHASIIGYLVMLTPVLAYGLAKGSDMAISNMVSGLSSALASGARAGALESTKQAQSTRSDIAIGEDISSQYLGSRELLSQGYSNGRIVTQTRSFLENNVSNNALAFGNGNTLTVDSLGNIRDSKLTDMSFAKAQSSIESLTKGLAKTRNASFAQVDSEAMSAIGSTIKSANKDDKTSIENAYQANFSKALTEARDAGTISQDAFKIGINLPFGLLSAGTGGTDNGSYGLSKKDESSLQDIHKLALMKSVTENESISAQLQNNNSLQTNKSFQAAVSANDTYNHVSGLSSNLTKNGLNDMITLSSEAMSRNKYGTNLRDLSESQRISIITDVATSIVDGTNLYQIQHFLTSPETFTNSMGMRMQENIMDQNLENRQNIGSFVSESKNSSSMLGASSGILNMRGQANDTITGGDAAITTKQASQGASGSDGYGNTVGVAIADKLNNNPNAVANFEKYSHELRKNFDGNFVSNKDFDKAIEEARETNVHTGAGPTIQAIKSDNRSSKKELDISDYLKGKRWQ